MSSPKHYNIGNKVTFNSEAGWSKGTIKAIHTKPFQVSGKDGKKYTKHASKDHPVYEIKSNISDHIAYHFAEALHPTKFPQGGKLSKQVADERYNNLYGPIEDRLNNIINQVGFKNLPPATQTMLTQTMGQFDNTTQSDGSPRYIPPVDNTIRYAQGQFNNMSDEQLKDFITTDWVNIKSFPQLLHSIPKGVGLGDMYKYYKEYHNLKSNGYTFDDGGSFPNIPTMKSLDLTPIMENFPEAKSGIHIKPQNKGKFTAYKKRTGKTTEEALHSKDPHVRAMANFARNSAKWRKGEDGIPLNPSLYDYDYQKAATLQPIDYRPSPDFNYTPQVPTHIDPNSAPDLGHVNPLTLLPKINPLETANVALSTLNYFTPSERAKPRYDLPEEYNQHPQGTGSTALFEDGGKFPQGGSIDDNTLFNDYYTQFKQKGYNDPERLASVMVLSHKYNVAPSHIFTTSQHPYNGTQISRRDFTVFGDDPNKPIASLSQQIAGSQAGSDQTTAPLFVSNYDDGGGLSRSSDYGSKSHPYPGVSSGDFAGPHRSYPIPSKADAIDALRLAHLHHDQSVINNVYAKYPGLKKGDSGLKLMDGTYDLSPSEINYYKSLGYNIEQV